MAAVLLMCQEPRLSIRGFIGVSPQTFSILFGINGLAIITGSFIIGRLSGIISEKNLLKTAVVISLVATSILLIMTIIEGPLASLVLSIFLYMITIGMIITSTFTLGMAKQGHRAGSASAVLGMLPLLLGAFFSPLAGINEASAVPMGAILFTTSLIGVIVFFTLIRVTRTNVIVWGGYRDAPIPNPRHLFNRQFSNLSKTYYFAQIRCLTYT